MNKKENIFTIGDKTNNGIISKFEIDSNGVRVFFEEKPINYHVNLNTLKHVEKIFTTEDGVDIYEGDEYFTVYTMCNSIGIYTIWKTQNTSFIATGKKEDYVHKDVYYFSTKKAAENYIKMNKPTLSLKEVLDGFDVSQGAYHRREEYKKYLTKIVKEKM